MTTKITTVYDYYVTQLNTLFSSMTRIPNPYSLEDNSINFLRAGYGLKLGGHNLFNADFCNIYQQYNFNVVFCREVIRMEHNATAFDDVVKNLNEDVFTFREHFYDIDNNNSNIDKINLGATDPVNFFVAGKNNFLFIETTISTIIGENYR